MTALLANVFVWVLIGAVWLGLAALVTGACIGSTWRHRHGWQR